MMTNGELQSWPADRCPQQQCSAVMLTHSNTGLVFSQFHIISKSLLFTLIQASYRLFLLTDLTAIYMLAGLYIYFFLFAQCTMYTLVPL